MNDASFLKLLRERTRDVVRGKPKTPCDLVFFGANAMRDLARLRELMRWIEPNGAVCVIRQKAPLSPLKDTDLLQAGLDAGLVDNKIANFSDTQGAMRIV